MKLTSAAQFSQNNLNLASLRQFSSKNRNRSAQLNSFNHFYTTVNSSIKYIADVVYQEIGEGPQNNRMSFANFKIWIGQNEGILRTFDKWLRKDIWGCSDSASSSSLTQATTLTEGYALVNMKRKKKRIKTYKKLFLELKKNILLVYSDSKKIKLLNIYILKDLEISIDWAQRKVKVFHRCSPEYRNLTLLLRSRDNFLRWADHLKPFMLESVEKHYLFCEKIGRGTFSTVNLAAKKGDHSKRFAIKTVDKENLKPEERELIREEAKIIKGLNHQNIVKFYESYDDYKKVYYVFELVEGGDLLEHVLSKGRLTEIEARRVFYQLIHVMGYLHRNNILHRDLKPENILIRTDADSNQISQIKLIDFGFATFFCKDNLPNLACGTLNYAAPEVLIGEEYDESSDLFSCGVILYFM